jgi:hypothetical protein
MRTDLFLVVTASSVLVHTFMKAVPEVEVIIDVIDNSY